MQHDLAFKVDLARIVTLARKIDAEARSQEERQKARALLTESFEGMTYSLAQDLINGIVTPEAVIAKRAAEIEKEQRQEVYRSQAIF